jgi:hypothetical protein
MPAVTTGVHDVSPNISKYQQISTEASFGGIGPNGAAAGWYRRFADTVLWHEKTMPAQGKCRIRCKARMFTESHPDNSAQGYVVEAVE